jgi:predicted metal-dependent hydrolase
MPDANIVITDTPNWAQSLSGGYSIIHYTNPANYVARLTDDHAALILVDGAAANWRFWTTTPKTSPATRRIPIMLVADDAAVRRAALLAGADLALRPADLLAQMGQLVKDYARIPDPALMEQLDCECQEALPPLAVQGVEKFNAGEYYPQHDLFEEQWVKTSGPVRDLYRAILQVGVAYYQIERGNHRGALKMLLRSVQWLSILPDVCQGVDIRQLRDDSYRVRAELERLNPADISAFDRRLLKPLKRVT